MSIRNLRAGLFILMAMLLLGIASEWSYQDELAERGIYCDMVKQGKWPDYRAIYATECTS